MLLIYSINYENCAEVLQKFTSFAKKNGKMSLADFAKYLQLPPLGAVNQVFNMYDRDKDGQIDFREFLIGLHILSHPASTEETLKLAFNVNILIQQQQQKTYKIFFSIIFCLFKMFDPESKGYISLSDLKSILYSALSMGPDEVEQLYKNIDTKNVDQITFDEFKSYIDQKPEYAKIFLVYNEIQMLRNNIEIEKLAEKSGKDDETVTITTTTNPNQVIDPDKPSNRSISPTSETIPIKRTRTQDDEVFVEDVTNDDQINDDASKKRSPIPSDNNDMKTE